MYQYFLRRLLLAIPTFFGCTIIVFFIVQLAPGSPLDQQILAAQIGGAEGSAGSTSSGQTLPKDAIEEMQRFYGFDKPIWQRYFIWLGIMERESISFKLRLQEPRNIGNQTSAVFSKGVSGQPVILNDNSKQEISGWKIESLPNDSVSGKEQIRIFQTEKSGILTGDFGKSYTFREPVLHLMAERIGISFQFGLIGLLLTYTVCVYLGISKALAHGSAFDFISSALVFVGYSIPGWALGSVLLVLLGGGSFLDVFPLGGFQSKDYAELDIITKITDRAYHAVLPTIAYSIAGFASLTTLMKNSLLDNMSQDYVRTAFAKGLRERRVVWVHAVRNSIIPIAANIGHVLAVFTAGSFLIETVFNINGIGKLSYEAILSRDYPIVFGFTVINVLILLVGSIISDFVLALVDPRIRFK